eukprot:542512-Hanusia_phi.AAC.1
MASATWAGQGSIPHLKYWDVELGQDFLHRLNIFGLDLNKEEFRGRNEVLVGPPPSLLFLLALSPFREIGTFLVDRHYSILHLLPSG